MQDGDGCSEKQTFGYRRRAPRRGASWYHGFQKEIFFFFSFIHCCFHQFYETNFSVQSVLICHNMNMMKTRSQQLQNKGKVAEPLGSGPQPHPLLNTNQMIINKNNESHSSGVTVTLLTASLKPQLTSDPPPLH